MRRSAAPSRCVVKAIEKRPGVDVSSRLSVQEPVETLTKKSDVQLVSDESSVCYYEAVYAKMSTKKVSLIAVISKLICSIKNGRVMVRTRY